MTIHRSLVCLALDASALTTQRPAEALASMTRALDPEVGRVIWETIEPLLPPPDVSHPLGCHRPRVPDEVCFRGILIRLVTGSSWVDIEAILGFEVSDTTLRSR